jgi:hypothetical protein
MAPATCNFFFHRMYQGEGWRACVVCGGEGLTSLEFVHIYVDLGHCTVAQVSHERRARMQILFKTFFITQFCRPCTPTQGARGARSLCSLLAQRSLELFSWNISRIRRRSSNSRRAEGLLRSSSICLISHLRCNMIADSSPEDSSVSTVRTSMLKRKKGACALLPRHVVIQTFARQDAILHQPVHHEGLLTDRRNSGDRRALRTPSPFLLPPSGDRIALEWSVGLHVWSCVIVRM